MLKPGDILFSCDNAWIVLAYEEFDDGVSVNWYNLKLQGDSNPDSRRNSKEFLRGWAKSSANTWFRDGKEIFPFE